MYNLCVVTDKDNQEHIPTDLARIEQINHVETITPAVLLNDKAVQEHLKQYHIAVIDTRTEQFACSQKAIKLGLNLLICGLQDITEQQIETLQNLSNEIGILIGFSGIAHPFRTLSPPVNEPFIARITRKTLQKAIDNRPMLSRILRYDLATLLALNHNPIRKIRAYSIPQCSVSPQSILIFIDFTDDSAITYSLNAHARQNNLTLELDRPSGTMLEEALYPTEPFRNLPNDLASLIHNISNHSEPTYNPFLVSLTIQTYSIITKKLGF